MVHYISLVIIAIFSLFCDCLQSFVMEQFEPSSGPINGRTILTIHGFNLGRKVDDVRHGIKVAGEPCRVFDEGYVPSIR